MTTKTPPSADACSPDDPGQGWQGSIGRTLHDSTPWWPPRRAAPAGAPDVVVILLDDLGFSDFGCYGAEIRTAAIDRMAQRGVRFANYTTVPMCTPARAALLTGKNPHAVGCGWLTFNDPGFPGYRGGEMSRDTPTLAEILQGQRLLDVHGRQVAQHARARDDIVVGSLVVAARARLRPLLRLPRWRDALLRAVAARRGQHAARPRRVPRRLLLHRRLDRQGDRDGQGARHIVARAALLSLRRAQRAACAAARQGRRPCTLPRRVRRRLGCRARRARSQAGGRRRCSQRRRRSRHTAPTCRRGSERGSRESRPHGALHGALRGGRRQHGPERGTPARYAGDARPPGQHAGGDHVRQWVERHRRSRRRGQQPREAAHQQRGSGCRCGGASTPASWAAPTRGPRIRSAGPTCRRRLFACTRPPR